MDSIVESWEKSLETWEVFMLRPQPTRLYGPLTTILAGYLRRLAFFSTSSVMLFLSTYAQHILLLLTFSHCQTWFTISSALPGTTIVSQWKGKDEDSKGWRSKKLKKINVYRIVVGQWRRHKSQRNDETVMVSEMKNEDTMRLSAFYRCMFPQLADL